MADKTEMQALREELDAALARATKAERERDEARADLLVLRKSIRRLGDSYARGGDWHNAGPVVDVLEAEATCKHSVTDPSTGKTYGCIKAPNHSDVHVFWDWHNASPVVAK